MSSRTGREISQDLPLPDPLVSRTAPGFDRAPPARGIRREAERDGTRMPLSSRVQLAPTEGLVRDRLFGRLGTLWAHDFALVAAPAGTGKTTLLAQFAERSDVASVWHRPGPLDASEAIALRQLGTSLGAALPDLDCDWRTLREALAALEDGLPGRMLLLIDDLHDLIGTPTLRMLVRFLAHRPRRLGVVVATRRIPDVLTLAMPRVGAEILHFGPDELRFRSWEVEDLFRQVFGSPLPPEDAAALTRRTEGWAAALKLFHLATTERSDADRRDLIRSLSASARLVRDYLARNVLAGIPSDLRDFLVGTSVLGRLDSSLCDEFMDRSDSSRMLTELMQRQLFLVPSDDGLFYRYHEALRSHLEVVLADQVGSAEMRRLYRRAGVLLHGVGATQDALVAFCRGEAWSDLDRLLGLAGQDVSSGGTGWLHRVPRNLRDNDPWLLLAAARSKVAAGSWDGARAAYRRAEEAFGSTAHAPVCARERTLLAAWLEDLPAATNDWSGLLRTATQRDPMTVLGQLETREDSSPLLKAACALLVGDVGTAKEHTAAALDQAMAEPLHSVTARVLSDVAAWFGGDESPDDGLLRAADTCDQLGLDALSRICRAITVARGSGSERRLGRIRAACEQHGDRWGTALVDLIHGFMLLMRGRPRADPFDLAATGFERLGAPVLRGWAQAGAALASASTARPSVEAVKTSESAAAATRAVGVTGAHVLAQLAHAHASPRRAQILVSQATASAAELGIALHRLPLPATPPSPTAGAPDPARAGSMVVVEPSVSVRCFGGFELLVRGQPLDEGQARPQTRLLLRLLAIQGDRCTHREHLVAALWPDVDLERGLHRLHVAVSALRKVLASTDVELGVRRDGHAYAIGAPAGTDVDVTAFTRALDAAATARTERDPQREIGALRCALGRYTGELLPEVGPVEWIVHERERRRAEAVEATARLATLRLSLDQPERATEACERGLQLDRYHDRLWRLAAEANRRAGNEATAARIEDEYAEVLEELGVQ